VLKAAPQRIRHLAPGDKLGRYELLRQIAVGGMAELYLARTQGIEGFEKLVVLKRILPQYAGHASFVDMFLHEARLAATLHHANIAQVYDIGEDEGDYFFAMEYVHGEDLDRIAAVADEQGVPMSMDAALTLVSGLCAGLHYAHERTGADGKPMNIVHRDVSPSNVVVSYDGAVKLVDFGIAWAASRPGTTDGGLKGKIAFMSPEQCRGKATLDRRSDLYSVGTLLYELTTGKAPFTGETEYQVLHQIVNDDAPSPKTIVPDYPEKLERIVLRALAREPEQRYATALALQADLEDFAHEAHLRISPLVLARLMGTLFPLRAEEWDQARTQGGALLEQQVFRRLDGRKSGRDGEETTEEHTGNERTVPELRPDGSEASPEDTASGLGAAPITFTRPDAGFPTELPTYERTDAAGEPLPPPPSIDVPAPPEPQKPLDYPMVSDLMSATPGALVTAAGKYGGLPTTTAGQRADPTERVRISPRRISSTTAMVRIQKRNSLISIGLVVAALGVAGYFVLRPSSPKRAAPAAEHKQMPVVAPPVVDPPIAAPPVDEPSAVAEPVAPPTVETPVDPAVTKPPVEVKVVEKKPAPKKVVVKPKPKPAPKPDPKKNPKEPSWNADSPFMPVRTN
jgi:serine/threonine protein kinase